MTLGMNGNIFLAKEDAKNMKKKRTKERKMSYFLDEKIEIFILS